MIGMVRPSNAALQRRSGLAHQQNLSQTQPILLTLGGGERSGKRYENFMAVDGAGDVVTGDAGIEETLPRRP
jgi:hypothetical protein